MQGLYTQTVKLSSIIYFTTLQQLTNIPPPPHSEDIIAEDNQKIFSETVSGNQPIVTENS